MAFDPTRLTAFGLNVFTGNAEGVRTVRSIEWRQI